MIMPGHCNLGTMCGRYSLHAHPDVIALQFGLASAPDVARRYNIAPGSTVLVVKEERQPALVRWGLVPRWAKDAATGAKLSSARAESVAVKPAFRDAYRRRRCLVPASGFYEWKREGGRKQPYYVRPQGAELFGFAALWESWQNLETCSIVTTEANAVMRPIHDRMPAIVAPEDYARWLSGEDGLLRPAPAECLRAYPVGPAVNRAANDSPALIEPAASAAAPLGSTRQLFGD